MAKIDLHKREFDNIMQNKLSQECRELGLIWRDWEKHPILKREIEMGTLVAKKAIPATMHDYVECQVDPFTYRIDFYIHVGTAEDDKYCNCS